MNELFDKLIIRIIFTIFICVILYLYKYIHPLFYPSSRKKLFKYFHPTKNAADALHLFARLIGIGIILSSFHFHLSQGIFFALLEFFIKSSVCFILYLVSIYILESISLYNFEYSDEILKRKNFSYALVCFAQTIGLALIIRTIFIVTQDSVIFLFLLWLFVMAIIGFANKGYRLLSNLSFNRLLIQKNMAVSLSYTGFFWGMIILITSSLSHEFKDIKWYIIQVLLKILLAIIIFPIFRKGLTTIYRITDISARASDSSSPRKDEIFGPEIGYGIYEGTVLLTSCFLTSIIVGNINFGNFYPI